MDHGLPASLVKKLALAGAFLVAVALLIGGEDDPGVIGKLGDAGGAGGNQAATQTPPSEERPAPGAGRSPRSDQALSAWYAENDTTGPAQPEAFQPTPIDHSHLINDARPTVETPANPPSDALPIDERAETAQVQ